MCLCDFGLSKPIGVHAKSMVGTPSHMAPEVMARDDYDYKADCFSFAVMIWCLFAGAGKHPPPRHPGDDHTRPSMKELENCPLELENLITEGWAKKAEKRPSMHEMLQRLTNIIEVMD